MGIIAAALSVVFVLFVLQDNRRRSRRNPPIELRPNCLISRYPLLFITGKKSPAYFLSFWGDLPHFLVQHGYDAFHLNLPWLSDSQREKSLQNFLLEQDQKQQKFHLVLDQSSLAIAENIFAQNHFSSVQSCLCITSEEAQALSQKRSTLTKASLKPLNHVVEHLALRAGGRSPLWQLHEMRTGQNHSLDLRRFLKLHRGTRPLFDAVLTQVIQVSEKDFFSQDHTTGETPHDDASDRYSGDLSFSAELP